MSCQHRPQMIFVLPPDCLCSTHEWSFPHPVFCFGRRREERIKNGSFWDTFPDYDRLLNVELVIQITQFMPWGGTPHMQRYEIKHWKSVYYHIISYYFAEYVPIDVNHFQWKRTFHLFIRPIYQHVTSLSKILMFQFDPGSPPMSKSCSARRWAFRSSSWAAWLASEVCRSSPSFLAVAAASPSDNICLTRA